MLRRLLTAARLGGSNSRLLAGARTLFDEQWYLSTYPDVHSSTLRPLLHYLCEGAWLGYDPHPLFDSDWYLQTYPSVAESSVNPLLHYLATSSVGAFDPNPCFSSRWYLQTYPDVAASGMNPLVHYVRFGRAERRRHSSILGIVDDAALTLPTSPAGVQRRVTIVIPVYGQWLYTERCLRALAATEAAQWADILVVDDHGPDDSIRLLGRRFPEVHVLALPENLGYTRAVNRAATQVDAPFILLLNNDVEPQPGFLDAMLDQMDADASVGAVGSRLVYPAGDLQEAGSIVWHDASGHNYERFGEAEDHHASYTREVDYCSAASLLVRTPLWRELGGFDERYAPAYYEDTDLAFGIRRLGSRIVYEPRSVVIHHEGRSHGTDTGQGLKSHQTTNRVKFRAKWSRELCDHAQPGEFPMAIVAHRRRQRVMVVVREALISPSQDSGSFRMLQITKAWQDLGFRTVHVTPGADAHSAEAAVLQRAGQQVITTQEEAVRFLAENRHWIGAIWYAHVGAAWHWMPVLSAAAPEVPTVFDTVDVHHLREAAQAALGGGGLASLRAETTRQRELWAMGVTDATVVVSAREVEYLRAQRPATALHLVSNVHPDQEVGSGFEERAGLLFIGSFQHAPNADGLEWFFEEVWPLLSPSVREAGIDIVGSPAPDHLLERGFPGIRVHGWVEDTSPFLARARVALAPLRYGGGVKGKVGEAWSHGLPVAATGVALDGMVEPGTYPSGDDPATLASVVDHLYGDVAAWREAQAVGFAEVSARFSPHAARTALTTLQEELDRGREQVAYGRGDGKVLPWDLPGWPGRPVHRT